jgi:hypothetical protein
MDRAKALDRIRKCLELSGSPEPHEAAAAMRQAQKLMKQFEISERELGLLTYGKQQVNCPIQAGKKIPLHLSKLINVIMRGIGVKALIHSEVRVSDASWCVTYYGPQARVEVAAHTHQVMYRACTRAWDAYLTGRRGDRTSFMIGWYLRVEEQVPNMAFDEEELAKTQELVDEDNSGTVRKSNNMKLKQGALHAGYKEAENFKLHRPLS